MAENNVSVTSVKLLFEENIILTDILIEKEDI